MPQQLATLLLVDDELLVTEGLKRAFHREPYRVLTATSAAAALELIARGPIDVIISDEQMPGMPGSAFLSLVRKQHPHTIRIILSGQANLEAAVRAINEGEVHRFLLKPCNPTDLMHTVRQALEHQRLEAQSRRLLREYQRQAAVLAKVDSLSPGLLHLDTDDQGAVVVDEADGESNVTELIAEIQRAMRGAIAPSLA
jgi:two-component system probable response regulator PhcQ